MTKTKMAQMERELNEKLVQIYRAEKELEILEKEKNKGKYAPANPTTN